MDDTTRPTDPVPTARPDDAASGWEPASPGRAPAPAPAAGTASTGTPPAAGHDPFAPPPPAWPASHAVRRSRSGLLVNALLAIALVVAVGGVAFAAGRAT